MPALQYLNGELVELSPEQEAALSAPAPVPRAVTPRQIRLALLDSGLSQSVDAYVATLSERQRIEWERASLVRRDNALIAAAATALGLTDEQADTLFRLAATL